MKLTLTQEFDNVAEAVAWLRRLDGPTTPPEDPPPAAPAKRQRRKLEPAPAPAVAPSDGKPPELVDVQAAVEKVFEAKGLNTARGLLSRYGAKRAQEMKTEHYAKFISHAEQVLAGGEV